MENVEVIRSEFEANGVTMDMDDFDDFAVVSRRNSVVPAVRRQAEIMEQEIRKIRRALSCMRPLKNKKHFCKFCKKNKEHKRVYSTHVVKDQQGRVTCPILQQYTCPICSASGAFAHTIKYCPFYEGIGAVETLFRAPENEAANNEHFR